MTAQVQAETAEPATLPDVDELSQIITAYTQVTEKLQKSHETLRAEVIRLQQELASTDAQLQRSRRLAALGEMAAGIAHEIRNPLAAIHLYARMLVEDLERDAFDASMRRESADTAGKIASAVRGLNAIVNDVLTFAREMKPRRRHVLVCDLFERALDAHRPAIATARVDVHACVEPDDLQINVDTDLLHQALLNLIRNAVDAMSSAGGRLTLTARHQGANVSLIVRDTGPGIDEQAVDRIFNPFFTTRDTGTGLGLAIVHRIVDAHGGAIAVTNDGGAVFDLSLPQTTEPVAASRTQPRLAHGATA